MQRKRGDGGRFFSPKTKEELAMLGQVRSSVSRNIFTGKKKQKKLLLHFHSVQFLPSNKTDEDGLLSSHAADGHVAGGSGRDGGSDDQSPVAPLANSIASSREFCTT